MIRSQQSVELENRWRLWPKADGARVPHRNEFKPYELPALVPNLAVVRLKGERCVVLMAGTNITERIAAEITGLDYMAFIAPAQRGQVLDVLRKVCGQPAGCCMHLDSDYSRGYTLKLEITLLPVAGDGGTGDCILALSVSRPGALETPAPHFLGDPITADWQEPGEWIDLGYGLPAEAGKLGEFKVTI
ncbi:PAS domain-containing protein [Kordiimonas lipolytica]|uniref:PAS domain-containing protein n=1 Tax=Kordiimonas lipolytica TaxID=1662421 RepID=A0ABV8UFC1_9PROT|nr:PAS domain-containing protein [Kordiimonas lipolytica]